MKRIIQLILVGFMIAPIGAKAQQSAKCFVQQYKRQEGFTVVTLGRPMMSFAGLFAKAAKEKEAADMLRRVDGVQILAFEPGRGRMQSERFFSEMMAFVGDNRYEELMEVIEHGNTVKIFGKTADETITGLIVYASSNHGNSTAMVSLTGRFTVDDLQNFNKKGSSINIF